MLVVLPFQEFLNGGLVIEGRIVRRFVQCLDVVALEADAVFITIKLLLFGTPFVEMSSLFFLAGECNSA